MFDIFLKDDMSKLLKKKSIVFMGDSNIRALYKDFLCLLHQTQFIPEHILRNKMEHTVFGDKLVFHGHKSNGRNYREEREATIKRTKVSFFFLTRVFDDYVKSVLKKITHKSDPDVIIINCCLWDITRWGYDGVEKYKKNLKLLMKEFKKYLPDCLVIWITTPPIACELKGGFLVKELQFLKYSLRFHVVEANHYARKIVVENGFDVLDSHYHLKMQIHRRSSDGVHWLPPAIRYVTNLLLTHISLAWDVPLPHRYESANLEKNLLLATEDNSTGANKSKKVNNLELIFVITCFTNSILF
ncbi:PC-esterase domain-containing protein 1A [Trichonephila inaurata madagascariensis]|uniref:PC-esterase domain-containing protein 1A n=1 Tax=Trichonephila inaurata madagascariensis TaxID=2747483 RepID=A0A8X6WXN7_9ARAC|nr:PC-esterase domain-containing protein 1A [Trichonephila inaurata madagascariensis]